MGILDGCHCNRSFEATNRPVSIKPEVSRTSVGEVHVLLCALDYKGTKAPLTATIDGKNFHEFCKACGVKDIEELYDNQATKENVRKKVKEIATRVQEDDYFVFFYAGHGTQMEDIDGDEKDDGMDEALCFVGPDGQLELKYFMSDDEFAPLISGAFHPRCRVIIIYDCCHSGTMADLQNDCWQDRAAVSLSGCKDSQTSGDTGKGGIFTHSLLLAVDDLVTAQTDPKEITCALVYNATLNADDKVFQAVQTISVKTPRHVKPNSVLWPLLPKETSNWHSPLRSSVQQMATMVKKPSAPGTASSTDLAEEHLGKMTELIQHYQGHAGQFGQGSFMAAHGLSPQVIAHILENPQGLLAAHGPSQASNLTDELPQYQGWLTSHFWGSDYRADKEGQAATGGHQCVLQ
eukprot:TRINITY_DN27355_c0_g1_i1.p1 TRINITY_DN27355_c0_g1~~TRINITY_DN27355_c0_g1_i1.p1  ORF type:complete len:405 (-),score=82.34 TRINITY_DN27355_c0_g1_i1:41-1255(-)